MKQLFCNSPLHSGLPSLAREIFREKVKLLQCRVEFEELRALRFSPPSLLGDLMEKGWFSNFPLPFVGFFEPRIDLNPLSVLPLILLPLCCSFFGPRPARRGRHFLLAPLK